ncbi:hypothetical protein [Fimbriiglobus ruber]|uniref:hypothetical protein n=1 Tax=Fimbriiglobus ruber TaxID=1908690 RepID=UPI0011799E5F|nr:hypothetical protein [Fimbriiglobus ruber]
MSGNNGTVPDNVFSVELARNELETELALVTSFLEKLGVYINHMDFACDAFERAESETDKQIVSEFMLYINDEIAKLVRNRA